MVNASTIVDSYFHARVNINEHGKKRREWCFVSENIDERARELGNYIIENKTTVRETAKSFGISKSTVHKDLTERLCYADKPLYLQVKALLEFNKAQRHIRGGLATRKKYKGK